VVLPSHSKHLVLPVLPAPLGDGRSVMFGVSCAGLAVGRAPPLPVPTPGDRAVGRAPPLVDSARASCVVGRAFRRPGRTRCALAVGRAPLLVGAARAGYAVGGASPQPGITRCARPFGAARAGYSACRACLSFYRGMNGEAGRTWDRLVH